ncbi:MAG: TonB family protein [Vulcanimicrobiaceae bacterium]
MAQNPTPPERRPTNTIDNVLAYSKRFLLYGFGISIALHLLFGPFIEWKHSNQEKQEVEKVSVTKKVTKIATPRPTPTPTPTPRPTPTPTPPPKVTPTPQRETPPPKQVRLKVNVPKQTSKSVSGQSSEQQYNVKTGSQQGVPQGVLASGPPATVAPTATVAATAKPSCANPNQVATATQKVVPDMPEIARQMGATGTAQIKVTLDPNGGVTAVTIFKSTNNKALDQAALQAAQQSKYAPEVRNCQPVGGSYLYTVTFESQ